MNHAGKDVADDERAVVDDGRDHASKGIASEDFLRELLMEGTASFLVVFWACLAALIIEMYQTLSFPIVSGIGGASVAFVLCWLGPTHFNPAVTITFTVFRRFPWTKLPFYVVVQLGGSVLACLAVSGIMKPREEHFYGTVPLGPTRLSFLLEFLGSAAVMVVVSIMSNGTINQNVGGLAIGGAVGTLSLLIGQISGGSMNPARSLGPAIVLKRYTSVWIYAVAPISGMIFGALSNAILRRSDQLIGFLCDKLKRDSGRHEKSLEAKDDACPLNKLP